MQAIDTTASIAGAPDAATAAPLASRPRPWPRVPTPTWRTVAVTALVALLLFPFGWLVQLALRPAGTTFDEALLFRPSLDAFALLLRDGFGVPLANSIVVSTVSTLLSLALGVPAAYVLERWRFRARKAVAFWILATRMAPPIAFTIPFFLAYRWLGLLDTLWGLALVYLTFNLSVVIWLMQGFFAAVPRSLEEAAWIDGCGIWQAFRHITLPLAAPGLAATAVLCFIFSWNDFFYALILTRTDAVTAPVAIVNFLQYEGWEWSKIAAGGTLVMLPVVVFSVLVRRYLVHGLTAGGVKD